MKDTLQSFKMFILFFIQKIHERTSLCTQYYPPYWIFELIEKDYIFKLQQYAATKSME